MGRLNNLKIWIGNKFDKAIKVSETDKIKSKLKEKEEIQNKLQESYYRYKGKVKSTESKLEGLKKVNQDIHKALSKCIAKNDTVNANKLKVEQKSVENKIAAYETILEKQTKATEVLYVRKTQSETVINNIKHKLEMLKIKEDFTDDMNDFLEIANTKNDKSSIQESEDIIDLDFNITEFKLEDFDNDVELENIIEMYKEEE